MKIDDVYILFLLYINVIDGLVYAGYNAITKQVGISSLDRYRCAEKHVGFEYIGHLLSPDGVCTAVQYGWSGVASPGIEYLRKTWNCNVFDTPIKLFKESHINVTIYETPIPGELVTGSSIEIEFIPQEPWNHFLVKLLDGNDTNVFHISFWRVSDEILFKTYDSGKWIGQEQASGIEMTTDSVAKITVKVLADAFKVSVNDKEKFNYHAMLSLNILRNVIFRPKMGSTCLLKSICFKDL